MHDQAVGAVVMVGPARASAQERLVDAAIRASALDLLALLEAQGIEPIIVAGPDLDWLPEDAPVIRDEDSSAFHFGQRLAGLVERYALSPVIYFGAGSAPLLDADLFEMLHGLLHRAEFVRDSGIPTHIALTNNLHSSDWIGISHAQDALRIIRRAERDNSLAWMLQENWDYDVRVLSGMRPVSSMDLDTPADLAIVRLHPRCPAHLRAVLDEPLLAHVPVDRVAEVAAQDGARLALVGRVSPLAWQALSKKTQAWIRVFSEERGMVASERLARGEVRSLLSKMLEMLGPEGFFAALAEIADALIMDSRVLMAAAGHYPDDADRFASDLYLLDAIRDPWLRVFTEAAANAPIPVLLGGHGVVAGGLYALSDIVAQRRAAV